MNQNEINIELQKKAHSQLLSMIDDCQINSKDLTILEIGSKNGYFLLECIKYGFNVVGTEINENYVKNIKSNFPNLNIIHVKDAKIPLDSDSVDYIVSFQVLEHVNQLKEVLKECARILKPEGYMYHVCPNYNSFYEGHYNIIWLPFLGKITGVFYLQLLGKDPAYFKKAVYPVFPRMIKKIFKKIPQIKVLTTGKKEFINKFNISYLKKIKNDKLKTITEWILTKPLIRKIIWFIIINTGTYYPLTIIVKKKANYSK